MNLNRSIRYFLTHLKAVNKTEHTIRNYGYDLEHLLQYVRNEGISIEMDTAMFKQTCLDYFLSLQSYYNEELKEDVPYDQSTLNRKRSSIRSLIRHLFLLGYIDENFSRQIEFNRKPNPPSQILLTKAEIQDIIHIHNQRIANGKNKDLRFMHRRNKVAFLTLLETGIKVWELLNLKWGNIHFDKHHIVIPKRKTIKTRNVSISRTLEQEFIALLQHIKKLEHYEESFLSGYIFFGAGKSAHYAINPKTIERMIDSLAEEAGIHNKNVTSQSLRHTMANYQLTRQAKTLSELTPLLGYSRNSVTKCMYSKSVNEQTKA